MNAVRSRPIAVRLVELSGGVLATLLLSFFLLALLNLVVEALFYPQSSEGGPAYADPDAPGVPVNALRCGFATALVVLYPVVHRTRLSETIKAVLLAAPVGVSTAALGVTFYERPALALVAMAVVALVSAVLLRLARLSWPYYASATLALMLAVGYAWPHS